MKTKKCFLNILLSLALVLGLIQGMSLTALAEPNDYPDSPYGLVVAGEPVTETNLSGKGWSYDPKSKTLTLNGFNFRSEKDAGIWHIDEHKENTLTIYLQPGSENKIEATGYNNYGICTNYTPITITGEGSLDVKAPYKAIQSCGLKIEGGTITATGTDEKPSYGIGISGNLIITNGTITATGWVGIAARDGGDIEISGGTVIARGRADDGIYACYDEIYNMEKREWEKVPHNLYIKGGKVTATGTGTAIRASGNLEISGGEVTASGGNKGIGADAGSLTIGSDATKVVASGNDKALYGSGEKGVKNAIVGDGWTNVDGTGEPVRIPDNTDGQDLSSYKKVQFPAAFNTSFGNTATEAKNETTPKPTPAAPKKASVKLKKSSYTIKRGKSAKIKVKKDTNGKVTFKKTKGNKKITVTKTGKIKVKKGAKKGKTYTIKVRIRSAKTSKYKAFKAIRKIRIKVK